MFAKLAKSAKKFDILGLEVNFLMNGSRTYNTYPGLFFTSLLASFLLYSFVQMVYDIENGVNPITQKTSVYLEQNEVQNIIKYRDSVFHLRPLSFLHTLEIQMECSSRIHHRKLIIQYNSSKRYLDFLDFKQISHKQVLENVVINNLRSIQNSELLCQNKWYFVYLKNIF